MLVLFLSFYTTQGKDFNVPCTSPYLFKTHLHLLPPCELLSGRKKLILYHCHPWRNQDQIMRGGRTKLDFFMCKEISKGHLACPTGRYNI